jgi:hypothetical protein
MLPPMTIESRRGIPGGLVHFMEVMKQTSPITKYNGFLPDPPADIKITGSNRLPDGGSVFNNELEESGRWGGDRKISLGKDNLMAR